MIIETPLCRYFDKCGKRGKSIAKCTKTEDYNPIFVGRSCYRFGTTFACDRCGKKCTNLMGFPQKYWPDKVYGEGLCTQCYYHLVEERERREMTGNGAKTSFSLL